MTSTVTLLRRCKTAQGWKRFPAAFGKKGKVRPGFVEIEGRQVFYEHGTYELRYYVGRQAKYTRAFKVGKEGTPSDALAERDRLEKKLTAKKVARAAGVRVIEEVVRARLAVKMDEHIADAIKRQALEAAEISRRVADAFLAGWRKTSVDEVSREDIFTFHSSLRRKGNSDRTVANKHVRLKSMLLFAGVSKDVIPPEPKYEKKLPTIYEGKELAAIMACLEGGLRPAMSVFLMCGLREQELTYLQWTDINQRERTLRVRSKPKWGFKVKDSEQRDIPLTDELFEDLKTWHELMSYFF